MNTLTLNPPISISLKYRFNLKFFLVVTSILIAGLLIFYIFQINELIQGSYLVKDYEQNFKQVTRENKILENNFLKSNSLDNIEILTRSLNYKKVGEVKYIQIMGSSVVAK